MTKLDQTNQPPVRRVLRRRYSEEYFTGQGWTSRPEEAQSFHDCLEAAQTCARYGLSEIELVLRVEGADSDLYCSAFR